MRFFSLFFILLIIFSGSVLAIGMSPAKEIIDYQEGKTVSVTYKLINNNNKAVTINVNATGPLQDIVTFPEGNALRLNANSIKEFDVVLNYPSYEEMPAYGRQRLKILALEVAEDSFGFSAVTGVEVWLDVVVPVPGLYGTVEKLDISNVPEGGTADVSITVKNRGTEPITGGDVTIDIMDPQKRTVDTVIFTQIDLAVDEEKTFTQELASSEYTTGEYTANAMFVYDRTAAPQERASVFYIGSTDVVLEKYTQKLTRGKINRVDLVLQSLWGAELKGIRGQLAVGDRIEDLPAMDFKEFGSTQVPAYIEVPADARDTMRGSLKLQIPVSGEDTREKEFSLEFDVVDEEKVVEQAPVEEKKDNSFLILGAIVVVLFLIVIILLLKKRR